MSDAPESSGRWPLERSEPGPRLPLFDCRFDWVRNPRTGDTLRRLVLASVDWVNVVALTADGRLVMVEQHRFGTGRLTLEPPGGMVDAGESHRAAAERELREETGFAGGAWRYLGSVEPNPAIHDHACHHWLAEGVAPVGQLAPGPGEAIHVRLLEPGRLPGEIEAGRLRHALALSALGRVFALWAAARSLPERSGLLD